MVLAQELLPRVAADLAEFVVDVSDASSVIGDADDGMLVEGRAQLFKISLTARKGEPKLMPAELGGLVPRLIDIPQVRLLIGASGLQPRYLVSCSGQCSSVSYERIGLQSVGLKAATLNMAATETIS